MGKGDRKTKRGKIIKGSYGVTRSRKKYKLKKRKDLVPQTKKDVKKPVAKKKSTAKKAAKLEDLKVNEPVQAVQEEKVESVATKQTETKPDKKKVTDKKSKTTEDKKVVEKGKETTKAKGDKKEDKKVKKETKKKAEKPKKESKTKKKKTK